MNYLPRLVDTYLSQWAVNPTRKPVLLRGARQVGKSWAVRHLSEKFKYYIEINFERNPEFQLIFQKNLDIERILSEITILTGIPAIDGETLVFFDEIQFCREAVMSLRFFKEERPGLHVIAAGSLLEFTLAELPTFGVGRIHSIYMYPMTFDEFLMANKVEGLMEARDGSSPANPLPETLHNKLCDLFRTYILVGGMPEVVGKWIQNYDYSECRELHNDIITGYEDDFAKYRKKVNPELLRSVFRSASLQLSEKFTFSYVRGGYKTYEVKKALELLEMAGLLIPVVRTSANGIPLGSEAYPGDFKILTLDSGLALSLLAMETGEELELRKDILTESNVDLVNKGPMAEMVAGLEIIRYRTPNLKQEIFYWRRDEKNSTAEIDYLTVQNREIIPVEVKAGTKGGMKSLWLFMDAKKLGLGVRTSLENFGKLIYEGKAEESEPRNLLICPLYALSRLPQLLLQR